MIVLLMAIIELIVISFLYSQNKKMFYTESIIQQISNCVKEEI